MTCPLCRSLLLPEKDKNKMGGYPWIAYLTLRNLTIESILQNDILYAGEAKFQSICLNCRVSYQKTVFFFLNEMQFEVIM